MDYWVNGVPQPHVYLKPCNPAEAISLCYIEVLIEKHDVKDITALDDILDKADILKEILEKSDLAIFKSVVHVNSTN